MNKDCDYDDVPGNYLGLCGILLMMVPGTIKYREREAIEHVIEQTEKRNRDVFGKISVASFTHRPRAGFQKIKVIIG